MRLLGTGLAIPKHYKDALPVQEAELAIKRRLGVAEDTILTTQNNIAGLFQLLGRREEALQTYRDVRSGYARLYGKEHEMSLVAAINYASSLGQLRRFEEAKSVLCKMIPVARRVSGDDDANTLRMRWNYAQTLVKDPAATLDDLREAVTTLEETQRIARRVLGGAHPTTAGIEAALRDVRAALGACETPSPPSESLCNGRI